MKYKREKFPVCTIVEMNTAKKKLIDVEMLRILQIRNPIAPHELYLPLLSWLRSPISLKQGTASSLGGLQKNRD